jgi:hypothetical protein
MKVNQVFPTDTYERNVMFFADDGIVLADNEGQIKAKINTLKREFEQVGLKMNMEKSQVIVFGRNGKEKMGDIRIVESITYLGVKVQDKKNIYGGYVAEKLKKVAKYKYWINNILVGRTYKARLGKVFWKGAILPTILHGMQVCVWKKEEIKKMEIIQNNVMRSILNMPRRTPIAYIQGENGYSAHKYRDMKMKLTMLQHVLKNNRNLKEMLEGEWEQSGQKWIEVCKDYLERIKSDRDKIEEMSKEQLKKIIDAKETKEWRENMEKHEGLRIYRDVKKKIGQGRLWKNDRRETILRMYQSGAILTNGRMGKK